MCVCVCVCVFCSCFVFSLLLFSVLVSWQLRPVDKMTSLRFNFLSLNVRGLRNQVKRGSVFRYLKDQNCLLYLLQETFSELKDEMVWKNEWGGDIFFSHGSNHSRGVCILTNPKFAISVDEFHRDRDGRIVSINVSFNKSQFSICNVYAPVKPTEQENFVQGLNEFLLRNVNVAKLIIGGDWNVTLEQIDKKGGARWEPTAYRNKLASMMKDLDLTDIFREKKPKNLSFTYESKFLKVNSRIDFFLVGNALRNSVIEIDTKASISPDHKAVKLCLQFTITDGARDYGNLTICC